MISQNRIGMQKKQNNQIEMSLSLIPYPENKYQKMDYNKSRSSKNKLKEKTTDKKFYIN